VDYGHNFRHWTLGGWVTEADASAKADLTVGGSPSERILDKDYKTQQIGAAAYKNDLGYADLVATCGTDVKYKLGGNANGTLPLSRTTLLAFDASSNDGLERGSLTLYRSKSVKPQSIVFNDYSKRAIEIDRDFTLSRQQKELYALDNRMWFVNNLDGWFFNVGYKEQALDKGAPFVAGMLPIGPNWRIIADAERGRVLDKYSVGTSYNLGKGFAGYVQFVRNNPKDASVEDESRVNVCISWCK
jgi:hypothetical protein